MADKKGTGILMVTIYDIPDENGADFNEWYNVEHMPENMENPHFLSAARYVPVASGPQHMTCYELETADAINYPPMVERLKQPRSEWTKRAFVGKVIINNVYTQIFPTEVSSETKGAGMAKFLAVELIGVPAEIEDQFNDWYNTIYLPRLETTPGVIRGRRYTATRGEPKYATFYELENEKAYDNAKSAAARDANPRTKEMLGKVQFANDFPCVFKNHFEM